MSSSFDRDFGQTFEPVEQTVLIDEASLRLLDRRPPGDPELSQEFRLWVIEPSGQEWEYPINQEISIGRSEDNQIALDDRAVSRHHLAINTDGKFYWFRDLGSGNGTQFNGEFTSEGWLTGGEKLTVGNTEIYFLAPEIAPPDDLNSKEEEYEENVLLAAEAEAAEAESEAAAEENEEEIEAAQAAQVAQAALAHQKEPESGGKVGLIIFLLLISLLVLGAGGFFVYKSMKETSVEPLSAERSTPQPSFKKALALFSKGQSLIKQKRWAEAETVLRQAASIIPPGNALRNVVLGASKKASTERKAESRYRKAASMYLNEEEKGLEVLELLKKIPDTTDAHQKAEKLRSRVIRPMLKEARIYAKAGKKSAAEKILRTLEVALPDHPAVQRLQRTLKGTKTPKPPQPRKRKPKKRKGNRRVELAQGLRLYKQGNTAAAIIFFRRKEASTASNVSRWARVYRQQIQVFRRYYKTGMSAAGRGSVSAAISNLNRAMRADRTLGGTRRSRITKALGQAYSKRGSSLLSRRSYPSAYQSFKNALRYNGSDARAKAGIRRLRGVARKLYHEARIVKDVDESGARKLVRKITRMLPSSDPLYRKARSLL